MIKLGKSEAISHVFYDDLTPADGGTVTVTVKNADNETVHSGSTTAVTADGIKTYSFTLPAQTELGQLTITWDGTLRDDTTYEEIIGNYLFELNELKSLLTTKGYGKAYTAAFLKDVRDAVTEAFESVTYRSFVGRRKSLVVQTYAGRAFLPTVDVRDVLTVDGDAFTGDYTPTGVLSGLSSSESTATVVFEYGLPAVSAEARSNALELATYFVSNSTNRTPSNIETMTDSQGNNYRMAIVGMRGNQVGVPSVDAFLRRFKFELPGVA